LSIQDILARLDKVKKTGPSNWIAACPGHDDRSPSLTLHETDDMRVLAHCFSGCDIQSIVDATGLGWDVWFPPKPIEHAKPVRRPFPAADVLEALAFEATFIATAALNIAQGIELSTEDKERLLVAQERFQTGRDIALGKS